MEDLHCDIVDNNMRMARSVMLDMLDYIKKGDAGAVQDMIDGNRMHPRCFEESPVEFFFQPAHIAAMLGQVQVLDTLLTHGFHSSGERHPLHIASEMGHLPVVKLLVEKYKTDVNMLDGKGQTPLYLATFNDQFHVSKYLVECGADVNIGGRVPCLLISVLHYKPHMCKYFIDKGANLNRLDSFGRSSLEVAARNGHDDLALQLIEAGADVNIQNHRNFGTPFLSVCRSGKLSLLKLLYAHGADVDSRDVDGDTALHLAVSEGHYHVVRHLIINLTSRLDFVNKDNQTAFSMALEKKDHCIIHMFRAAGYSGGFTVAKQLLASSDRDNEKEKGTFYESLVHMFGQPFSLQELAVFRVREHLSSHRIPIQSAVHGMLVPKGVKNCIMLSHIPLDRPKTWVSDSSHCVN